MAFAHHQCTSFSLRRCLCETLANRSENTIAPAAIIIIIVIVIIIDMETVHMTWARCGAMMPPASPIPDSVRNLIS